jgi:nicotinamidase/pyrazinamidase
MRAKNALILVDLQNDFVPGGALGVPQGDAVIPIANRLIRSGVFDLVIATQDWHPRDHGSFAANHRGKTPGDVVNLNGLRQILWPVHCVQNTRGAEFVAGLEIGGVDKIIQKGTDPWIDSYSAFFDNAHRKSTGLDRYLKARNITDVYLAGLATDYCVKFSALDARRLGFVVHVIEDACRGVNLRHGDVDAAIEQMRSIGVEITKGGRVLAALRSAGVKARVKAGIRRARRKVVITKPTPLRARRGAASKRG